jgi:hypothetical protein
MALRARNFDQVVPSNINGFQSDEIEAIALSKAVFGSSPLIFSQVYDAD